MQTQIVAALEKVVAELLKDGVITHDPAKSALPKIMVSPTPRHVSGDYSTNLVMTQRKRTELEPQQLAALIIREVAQESWCDKAEYVAPGYINFYCSAANQVIQQILAQGRNYGAGTAPPRPKVLIEYVSANPTGPLHTGHGRAAALGSCLAQVLRFVGCEVDTEYYVNDWGRQINILIATLCWRLLQQSGISAAPLPAKMYQGVYVQDLAASWQASAAAYSQEQLKTMWAALSKINDAYEEPLTDTQSEQQLDELIASLKQLLGENFMVLHQYVMDYMLASLKRDLQEFGVEFTSWYHESSTAKSEISQQMIEILRQKGYVYTEGQTIWFKSSEFGDDKDRVLVRSNGQFTYFGNDIAYHHNKYERGYDRIIDILGADHHGYIKRIRSSMAALGHNPQQLEIILAQLVFLVSNGERLAMSTRAGKFEELGNLVADVGLDAARFFYLMHRSERELNFDLDLARTKSKENPVYYVQYAHARICRIFEQPEIAKSWEQTKQQGLASLALLNHAAEKQLVTQLVNFPQLLQKISETYEVHLLPNYLRELASDFHTYYNSVRVLAAGDSTPPRLCLCAAINSVLQQGLKLLGVAAPERM